MVWPDIHNSMARSVLYLSSFCYKICSTAWTNHTHSIKAEDFGFPCVEFSAVLGRTSALMEDGINCFCSESRSVFFFSALILQHIEVIPSLFENTLDSSVINCFWTWMFRFVVECSSRRQLNCVNKVGYLTTIVKKYSIRGIVEKVTNIFSCW